MDQLKQFRLRKKNFAAEKQLIWNISDRTIVIFNKIFFFSDTLLTYTSFYV